jgi:hypothetical protein
VKLSEHEIRDITKYLEAGKSLPEKYRFLLFEDKKFDALMSSFVGYKD